MKSESDGLFLAIMVIGLQRLIGSRYNLEAGFGTVGITSASGLPCSAWASRGLRCRPRLCPGPSCMLPLWGTRSSTLLVAPTGVRCSCNATAPPASLHSCLFLFLCFLLTHPNRCVTHAMTQGKGQTRHSSS